MLPDKIVEVTEWLIDNGEVVREVIRPQQVWYIYSRPTFVGNEDFLANMAQDNIVNKTAQELQTRLGLNYEEAHSVVDWPLLEKIWQLDKFGSNL